MQGVKQLAYPPIFQKKYCKNCNRNISPGGVYCYGGKNPYTGEIIKIPKSTYNSDGNCKYYKRRWWKFWCYK